MQADKKIRCTLLVKALLVSASLVCCCLFIVPAVNDVSFAGVFDIEETAVAPSPADAGFLEFKKTEKVLDFDVAKDGPHAAILIENQGGRKVLFWDPGSSESPGEWPVPKGFTPRALAWHPAAKSFFLAGKQGNEYVIMRVDKRAGGWEKKLIYRTHQEIRRLVPAPRPYAIVDDPGAEEPAGHQGLSHLLRPQEPGRDLFDKVGNRRRRARIPGSRQQERFYCIQRFRGAAKFH